MAISNSACGVDRIELASEQLDQLIRTGEQLVSILKSAKANMPGL
jgi:hypothetical protein